MGNCLGTQPSGPEWSSRGFITRSSRRSSFEFGASNGGQSGFSVAESQEAWLSGELVPVANLKVYTFVDLKSATMNFRSDMVLGGGGFGTVYKGWVDKKTLVPSNSETGMMVAIKKLDPKSMQGFEEWQSEVNFLARLSHPNVVKLLGYCWEDEELLLVYEFMQKGTLENSLFRRNPAVEPLAWDLRLKIAIGAARGLAFLHSSDEHVIYRDFKASNILLDENYNAKISDFGLAKMGPSGGLSYLTTRVMGTHGYVAPEYVGTGCLSVRSDVYGFGVVMLEMLTGLRALDYKRPGPQRNLVHWTRPMLSQNLKKLKSIMDSQIEGQYSLKAAEKVARLALKCLEIEPSKRPSMEEVAKQLEQVYVVKTRQKESTLGSK